MFLALVLNSLRLLLRQKMPLPLFVIGSASLPLISYFAFSGDGTLVGVLKMMWGWQFYVASAFFMLVTIYLATTVLESEFRGFQILTTAVKPIPRWMLLFSKFTAVCILTGAGVIIAGASSYAALRWRSADDAVTAIRRASPETVNFTAAARQKDAAAQRASAMHNFFTARRTVIPQMPDVLLEIRRNIAALKAEDFPGGKKPSEKEIVEAARNITLSKSFPIAFNAARDFNFTALPQTDAELTFRYKVNGSQREGTLGWLQAYWEFSGAAGIAPYVRETNFRGGKEQEITIPGKLIGKDGRLKVILGNISAPTDKAPAVELTVPLDGLRLLIPDGSFAANFSRAWVLLWIRLCLLAAVGVGFSPIIGGPVNGFLMVAVLFVGSLNSSFSGICNPPPSPYRKHEDSAADTAKRWAARGIGLLPDFAESDPVDTVNKGELVSWRRVGTQAGKDILLRGGLALLLGTYFLRRRELAICHS